MGRALAVVLILGTAFLVCLLAYLGAAVPGAWFPAAGARAWTASELTLARGTGSVIGDELVITAPDESGIAVVSVRSALRSRDYPAVAWIGADFPDTATPALAWQSDYIAGKNNTAAIRVEAGQPLPVVLSRNSDWVGNITGLALIVRGTLPQPIRIRGVVAKPMGALEVLRDRASEWLAFEGWTGTSINTMVGGADVQDLPLPLLIAAAAALAMAFVFVLTRWRPRFAGAGTAAMIAAIFLAAWLALDLRWTWNLVRQVGETWRQFGSKDAHERHLAAEDGALYAFIEKARAVMPSTPARVFILSDAPYFRGRAAYHLYPHNAFADTRGSGHIPANLMRAGDWVLVFHRTGAQYDAAQHNLRWDNVETVSADAKLVGQSGALFLIR